MSENNENPVDFNFTAANASLSKDVRMKRSDKKTTAEFCGIIRAVSVLMVFIFNVQQGGAYAQQFIHPGLLQSMEDIGRIRLAIKNGEEPIYSGYQVFQRDPQSQSNYQIRGPLDTISRNPTIGQGTYDSDAAAAYQNALMWTLTGKKEFANKAIEIINSWASALKVIGGKDAILMAGLGPFKMINAAEILRYTNSGWDPAAIRLAELNFKKVILPVLQSYALFANGNWDTAAMKTVMAIGVFCNDRPLFENALRYYTSGEGNGSLKNYIINETGQCQESGRDQAHTQLGIGHLADCAEIAWNQGIDLYAYADNRLLRGFEYTAQYNLGEDVTYIAHLDKTGKYLNNAISSEKRGAFRTIFEQVYNHYQNRVGIQAPFTEKVAANLRPEGHGSGGDNIGFGTMLYSRKYSKDPENVPVMPSGISAEIAVRGNLISWPGVRHAKNYCVERSERAGGPYIILYGKLSNARFHDLQASPGRSYFYRVSASNNLGSSDFSQPIAVTAGLPSGWRCEGDSLSVLFENGLVKLKSVQTGLAHQMREENFLCHQWMPGGVLTARFIPQVNSQFSKFGFKLTGKDAKKTLALSFYLSPQQSANVESPRWQIRFEMQSGDGRSQVISTTELEEGKSVTFGRLTGPIWFRIEQKQKLLSAYFSYDGLEWLNAGDYVVGNRKIDYAGLVAASGKAGLSAAVTFDELTLRGR